jgi:phage replication-related protein YjqB (UPF0714/DUF867 family)
MFNHSRRALLGGAVGAALSPGSLLPPVAGRTHRDTTDDVDGATLPVRPASDLSTTPRGPEVLFAPRELVAEWSVDPGQQVRLRRTDDEFAVYTVAATDAGTSARTLWLTDAGRARLGTQSAFEATIESPVPDQTHARTAAERLGEYVEEVRDGGRDLVVGAPHGGKIEPYTDDQALRVGVRTADSTVWIGRGWRPGGGAYDRWHVTSTDIHPASFPGLGRIADRSFEYAVSFHGYGGDGIRIGGGAPKRVKREVRAALGDAVGDVLDVHLATDGPYAGSDPDNFVNWLTENGRNGIQLEQSFAARRTHWQQIADAVAGLFE